MKLKHILWISAAFIALASAATAVAVFVNRLLARKKEEGYIECECDSLSEEDLIDEDLADEDETSAEPSEDSSEETED